MPLSPSIIFLVIANLLPIVGVIWWQWSVFAVMLLFWLENIIVGLLNMPRILFASGDTGNKYTRTGARIFTSVFFVVHYGLFTFVHGTFVFSMFGQDVGDDITPQLVWQVVHEYQLYWAVLALFVSHAVSLVMNYFVSGEYKTATVKKMMNKPYSRIVVLHIGIIAGGFLIQSLQQPLLGLIALIIVKIIVDIRAHRKEHREFSATIRSDSTTA